MRSLMPANRLLGFEIGSYRMVIVEMEHGQLVNSVSLELPENLVKNGQITAYAVMADFIKNALKEYHIREGAAAISISSENYYLRHVTLPVMSVQQLQVNLPFEFHDYVTDDMSEYVYDYSVLSINDQDMTLLAAATRKQLVSDYTQMFKKAGINLVKIVPDVLSIQALLYREYNEANAYKRFNKISSKGKPKKQSFLQKLNQPIGKKNNSQDSTASASALDNTIEVDADAPDFAVLNLDFNSTYLHFYSHGTYEITRTMDQGEASLAKIIMDNTDCDKNVAVIRLERNEFDEESQPQLFDAYDGIATDLSRVLNFYNYNYPDNKIDKIYYYGGGSNITDLGKAIANTIEMDLIPITNLISSVNGGGKGNMRYDMILGPAAAGAVIE